MSEFIWHELSQHVEPQRFIKLYSDNDFEHLEAPLVGTREHPKGDHIQDVSSCRPHIGADEVSAQQRDNI